MTVFLFVLTQKRVMTAFTNNVLGLMKVMCGTRVTLLSFGTREYSSHLNRQLLFTDHYQFIVCFLNKRPQTCKVTFDTCY